MPLHLRIENETFLPDGGPIAITVTPERGIDIGRETYLDWVLPDPTRSISGKHCEIRFKNGDYWLIDTSTNGTFVNRGEYAIDAPHRLQTGDRIEIGKYIVVATVSPDALDERRSSTLVDHAKRGMTLWTIGDGAAPPADPAEAGRAQGQPAADALDWLADIPALPASGVVPLQQPRAPATTHRTPGESPVAPHPGEDPFAPVAEPPPGPQPSPDADTRLPPASALADMLRTPGEPDNHTRQPVSPAPPPVPRPDALVNSTLAAMMPPVQTRSPPAQMAQTQPRSDMRAALARGLGIEPQLMAESDDAVLAEMVGRVLRQTVESLMQMQQARAQSKGLMRSANTTMIQLRENNPLRFTATADDALRIMLGPPSASYQNAEQAIKTSFQDQKKHQALLFSAMQQALTELIADLDPKAVEAGLAPKSGVAGLLRSREAMAWEHYRTVWAAKAGKGDNGMLDVFMRLFATAYDVSS